MKVETPSVFAKKFSLPLIRNWPITIFSVGMFFLFILLAVWQLQRAEQKTILQTEMDARLSAQPQMPEDLSDLRAYRTVKLYGYYQDAIYFLDNRTRNGRVGYEVLQVFSTPDSNWLINRGWVALGDGRKSLPKLNIQKGFHLVHGYLYPVDSISNLNPPLSDKLNRRIQKVDRNFTQGLHVSEKNWSVRLFADSATALVTEWNFLNSGPERHRAYAFQWFSMAIAILFLWAYTATRFVQNIKYKICSNKNRDFKSEK
ncbi:SURF1 family protein [Microbulbifer sp. OS29]|uniref:SURF1-like protein n=1 Tax=Microbulbifer okhotskensis TaxID=2926617 RepID=A0A9X2EIV8_9GAMM|nr:SURF1 family protein [Microbulbifer okhotskensis]MCO1333047.1 SURF1 family protein [Microbulbifer okhotskensis]